VSGVRAIGSKSAFAAMTAILVIAVAFLTFQVLDLEVGAFKTNWILLPILTVSASLFFVWDDFEFPTKLGQIFEISAKLSTVRISAIDFIILLLSGALKEIVWLKEPYSPFDHGDCSYWAPTSGPCGVEDLNEQDRFRMFNVIDKVVGIVFLLSFVSLADRRVRSWVTGNG
jgi:hypothetical protein